MGWCVSAACWGRTGSRCVRSTRTGRYHTRGATRRRRVEFNRRWGELLAESFTHPWGIEPAHVAPVDPAHDEVTAEMLLALGDFFIEPEEDGDG